MECFGYTTYMNEDIQITRSDDEGRFSVLLTSDDGSSTLHEVILGLEYWKRFSDRYNSQEAFVRACFMFLLERVDE